MKQYKQIEFNRIAHNKIYLEYDGKYPQIFNPIEQERLHTNISETLQHVKTNTQPKFALDYGCGTGNLTRHLVELNFKVMAADVSENFIELIKDKYAGNPMVDVLKVNGQNLAVFPDNYFDLAVTYAVLHHVPDYLSIIKEMVRVIKPGGAIYIDGEASDNYWKNDKVLTGFLKLAMPKKNILKKAFKISVCLNALYRLFDPRYTQEGDIHVWPDDHIKWSDIQKLLTSLNCQIIIDMDYLTYSKDYPLAIYEAFKNKCTDNHVLAAIKY